MAISNNSTGLRPGVCTSTTRPTAPYEGQHIYETDTDLTYVWGGSAWQQVSGGTAVGNSGLVYITSGTFSGSAIDGVFTSTYDNYRIVVSNIITSSNVLINFNFRNTTNATDSTSNYYTSGRRFDNGTNYDFSQGPVAYGTTAVNTTTVGSSSFVMDIFQPRTTNMTNVVLNGIGGIATVCTVQSATVFYATTNFAGIIFSASGGNTITGGLYTVYGYRK